MLSGYDRPIETSAPNLPHAVVTFDRPPVIEVALAIQFSRPTVETIDVATFASRLRNEFPRLSDQPSRPPMEETFEEPQVATPMRFEVLDKPPAARFWLLSEDESRLVQIQHDLFTLNWRKASQSSKYPRYVELRRLLRRLLASFESVLSEEGKQPLAPNWCELTYINHIDATERGRRLRLHDVTVAVRRPTTKSFLPAPEDSQLAQRFRIEEDGKPIGRLNFVAAPAYRTDDTRPIWVLTLTTRVRAAQPTVESAFARLDLAHEWAVQGFKELTTSRMHQKWGLRNRSSA